MAGHTLRRRAPAGASRHRALFYRDQAEYLRVTTAFIQGALHAGDPITLIAPPDRLELLTAGLDPSAVPEAGLIDITRTGRNPARLIPALLGPPPSSHDASARALPTGGSQSRTRHVLVEFDWQERRLLEYSACVQHEALVEAALDGHQVDMLCLFDAASLAGHVLQDAAATHSVIMDAAGERRSDDYDPQRALADYNLPLPEPVQPPVTAHFDESGLDDVRALVIEYLQQAGLPVHRALDAELAVNELAVNSVLHGGGQGTLRLWADSHAAVCEISDNGHLSDPLVGRRLVDPAIPGGRGIFLVHHLADLVRTHTRSRRTVIRAYFAR